MLEYVTINKKNSNKRNLRFKLIVLNPIISKNDKFLKKISLSIYKYCMKRMILKYM